MMRATGLRSERPRDLFLTFGPQKIICDALAMEETRGCVDIFDKPPIYDNIIWLMLARNRRTKSTKRKYK